MKKHHHKKRSRKTGMEPGTVLHVGEVKVAKPVLSIIKYAGDSIVEETIDTCDLNKLKTEAGSILWVNVHGLQDARLIQEIGQAFGLHALVLEDIVNTNQRPKTDNYSNYLYIVTRHFYYDATELGISSEQISLVLGHGFVLTFQERATGSFEPIRERLRTNRGHIREQGPDYLAYALLDVVVDRYFDVLEQMSEDAETLEEGLLRRTNEVMLRKIHLLKRAAMDLRRTVWPMRETLNVLIRDEKDFFQAGTILYLRDVFDHTVYFIESLEGLRDLLAGMMDIYLSSVSNRVNIEVRVLTVVTMLFMPATLITGIFGMNFDVMPWLKDVEGFWWALGLMFLVAGSMGLLFWRRQWLSRN